MRGLFFFKMMQRLTVYVLYLLLGIPSTLLAQPKRTLSVQQINLIDSAVTTMMSRQQVPGVSVSIAMGSDLVWSKGYGKADLENDMPAKPNTVYRLASVSKAITAVAVMQLVENGKIDLNAPVQKYIPAFPLKKYPVTTRQLLGHLSGVRHYRGEDEFNITSYPTLTDGMVTFKDDSLLHKPETQFTYTTYGYALLGVIIERASGMTYAAYLRENIFKLAGMTQSTVDDPGLIIPHRTRFYDVENGMVRNARFINSSYRWPGGGLLSSSEDLARFLMAVQQGKLIKPSTLKEMMVSGKTSDGKLTHYGYGWILGISQHPEVVWHGGVQPGATTAMGMIPQKNLSVVVLTNSGTLGSVEIDAITSRIFSIIAGQ